MPSAAPSSRTARMAPGARVLLALLLLPTAAADPAAAHNDLVSSAARPYGPSRQQMRLKPVARPRKASSLETPLDGVPAPAFPTTADAAPAVRDHSTACLPVAGAICRALGVIALVIIAQTIGGDHAALPQLVRAALASWQHARGEWPLALATACAFCLYSSADVLAQCVASRRHAHEPVALDMRRMVRTGLTASLLSGFLAVFYFGWLDRFFAPGAGALAQWASLAGKVGMDVGVYEPVYDVLYITLQSLLRGEGLSAAQHEVRNKLLAVWSLAPRYWILADLLNFSLVPLRLRPMANALLSIPWGMYISSVANAAP